MTTNDPPEHRMPRPLVLLSEALERAYGDPKWQAEILANAKARLERELQQNMTPVHDAPDPAEPGS